MWYNARMSRNEAWFASLIVAANIVMLVFLVCRSQVKSQREDYVRDRVVDRLRNKVYCKECNRREKIESASVEYRERNDYGDWYQVYIRTDRHKDEPFRYSVTINSINGCIGTLVQDGGPGWDL